MNVWHASKFSELYFSRRFFPCGYQLHGLPRRPFELHEDGCGGLMDVSLENGERLWDPFSKQASLHAFDCSVLNFFLPLGSAPRF